MAQHLPVTVKPFDSARIGPRKQLVPLLCCNEPFCRRRVLPRNLRQKCLEVCVKPVVRRGRRRKDVRVFLHRHGNGLGTAVSDPHRSYAVGHDFCRPFSTEEIARVKRSKAHVDLSERLTARRASCSPATLDDAEYRLNLAVAAVVRPSLPGSPPGDSALAVPVPDARMLARRSYVRWGVKCPASECTWGSSSTPRSTR